MRNFVGLPSASVHSDLSWWLHVTIYWNQDWFLLAFSKFGNSHLQEQLSDWSLVQYQAYPQKISPLIFYRGIAHTFEYLLNQQSCLEDLHPALALCTLFKISSVKGWLEALHPNPFVWLVCELVCDLVHSLDLSLVAVIESNNWPELDFQLLSLDLWMHLHDLLKERVPIAPRTWNELSLHSINSFSMLQWIFQMQSVVDLLV